MSKAQGAGKPQTQSTAPYNEYDDLVDNDLPPAYEAAPSSSSRPPQAPLQPPHHNVQNSYPGTQYQHSQWPYQGPLQHLPTPHLQQQMPVAPYNYPPGYFCTYCQNTGFKRHNGHPCGTCERNFGYQGGHVQHVPWGMAPIGGVTYMAGDPRIGGRVCGNCKGHGVKSSLFGLVEEQCMGNLNDL